MRILFCAPYPVPSTSDAFSLGAARKIRLTISALLQLGHEVIIINSSHTSFSDNNLYRKSWSSISINESILPVFNPPRLGNRRLGKAIQALLAPYYGQQASATTPIDLVWIYNAYFFETRLALSLHQQQKIPFILQLEDLPLARQRSLLNVKPRLDSLYFNSLCQHSLSVLAVNSTIVDRISVFKPRENIVLFPPIIDPEIDELCKGRISPFQNHKIQVGYFGRLAEEKGVSQILRMIDCLGPNYKFHIGGMGPLEGAVTKKAATDPSKLTFHGFVSDQQVRKNLCSMDILLNPHSSISTMRDGVYPFKMLEYIATESYVITTPLPSLVGADLSFLTTYDGSDSQLLEELIAAPQKYSASISRKLKQEALSIAGYERIKEVINQVLEKL